MPRSRTEKLSFLVRTAARVSAVLWLGCAGGTTAAPPVHATPALPVYEGSLRELFDDGIDPSSVGLADVTYRPRADPALRNRTLKAEVVTRVRVSTVTVDVAAGQPVYHVQLSFVGTPFVQRGFPDATVSLSIRSDSPAFGVVKWLDTRLIGKTFIGFVRRFAGAEEPRISFHLSADSAEVVTAIQDAKTFAEAAGL
jgi:hypothetical protein